MRSQRHERGYSLPELLVVVAIIGIVALVTIPAITQLMPQYRIRSASSEIAATLRFAREKAVSMRRPWRVSFDPTTDQYALSMLDAPGLDMSVGTNWGWMGENGKPAPSGVSPWRNLSAMDLRLGTATFKDVDCPRDSVVDVIFLRDGSIATNPTCGQTNALTFGTRPSVVLAVNNSVVAFNRYALQVDRNGNVYVVASKQ